MSDRPVRCFALEASRAYAESVADALGVSLGSHEERGFEDGEHKSRPLESVRGEDAYVIHSLYGDPEQTASDKLVRLLFFLGAVKDAGAHRVTAVTPYLCYARKDQKTKPRDPITTRYVASLFEAVGVDRVVTIDVHNIAAFQNAFRCATEHLVARPLFASHCAALVGDEEISVVSPDAGGIKRADRMRADLERALGRPASGAFLEKYRSEGVVRGGTIAGDVRDRTAIIVDDLIGAGTTMGHAAAACRDAGARRVIAVATHGIFVGDANDVIAEPAIEQVIITDTVPPFRLHPDLVKRKVTVLSTAPLIADAIRCMHEGRSMVELTL